MRVRARGAAQVGWGAAAGWGGSVPRLALQGLHVCRQPYERGGVLAQRARVWYARAVPLWCRSWRPSRCWLCCPVSGVQQATRAPLVYTIDFPLCSEPRCSECIPWDSAALAGARPTGQTGDGEMYRIGSFSSMPTSINEVTFVLCFIRLLLSILTCRSHLNLSKKLFKLSNQLVTTTIVSLINIRNII